MMALTEKFDCNSQATLAFTPPGADTSEHADYITLDNRDMAAYLENEKSCRIFRVLITLSEGSVSTQIEGLDNIEAGQLASLDVGIKDPSGTIMKEGTRHNRPQSQFNRFVVSIDLFPKYLKYCFDY
jgi:hypothetical protein